MMISVSCRTDMVVWRRLTLWPVGFCHKGSVTPKSSLLQLLHYVALPVFSKGPRVDGYYIQAHLRVYGLFSLDSPVIILSSSQAEILNIGSKLGQVEIRVPDPRFVLVGIDEDAWFILILNWTILQKAGYSPFTLGLESWESFPPDNFFQFLIHADNRFPWNWGDYISMSYHFWMVKKPL